MTDENQWFLENHRFLQSLGIEIVAQSEGAVTLRLPYDDAHTNPGSDSMQGGVVATLIDHAGGAVLRTTLDRPFETPHASTELSVSFVRPATVDLVAEARTIRVGGSTAVVEVTVEGEFPEGRETVAAGRVSLHLDRSA